MPAGSLEGANTTQPVFVYGKRYVQRPYAVEADRVALPLKDEEIGAKRFVLADSANAGVPVKERSDAQGFAGSLGKVAPATAAGAAVGAGQLRDVWRQSQLR